MAKLTDVIGGLLILEKYAPGKGNISAEHDVIYAGPPEEIVGEDAEENAIGSVVSKADAARLLELGWHIDSECESWARFV